MRLFEGVAVEIRRLNIAHYDEMVELWSRANLSFRPKVRDSKDSIRAQMKANPDYFLGAFEKNHIVGTVVISSDLRRGWINRLAVDPKCRRRGVAAALIAEAENVLRKHGIRIFAALVDNDNAASRRLLEKCGYVEHHGIIYFSKRDSKDV